MAGVLIPCARPLSSISVKIRLARLWLNLKPPSPPARLVIAPQPGKTEIKRRAEAFVAIHRSIEPLAFANYSGYAGVFLPNIYHGFG